MALSLVPHRRLATAVQQTKIPRALEQAEEVLSRIVRFVDAQYAAFIDLAQQALHAVQHALRPGLEENLRELGVLVAQGHHQAVQVHRFVTVDQMMKTARDVQQHSLHFDAFRQFEKQRR